MLYHHDRPLSIRSPEGIEHEKITELVWGPILSHFPGGVLQRTSDTHPADGIIKRANKAVALIEVKSRRDFDEHEFWTERGGRWLLTAHKIKSNIPIAKALGCPFYGAMHIVKNRVIYFKTLWDEELCSGIEWRDVETQARINSTEKITRPCAFVPMNGSVVLRY